MMQTAPGPTPAPDPGSPRDRPSIVAPGPALTFGAVIAGVILDQFFWIGVVGSIERGWRVVIALLLMALGGWFIWRANVIFRDTGTPFQPWLPTTALAMSDIYGETRNPMYQGFLILSAGVAVLLRSDWALLLLIPAALIIHYGVVLREEAYLQGKFGEPFRAYMRAVPRWGIPFLQRRR
jgi:protein-S-isoprenylcysteine O-methyltransferase Ste14